MPPPRITQQRRTLWWLVGGTAAFIVLLWIGVVGLNLGRTAQGEDSLAERIKHEIRAVFGKNESTPSVEPMTNEQLDDLERRVFPNVNVSDSGTFTIP
jgi:hypothetical protein